MIKENLNQIGQNWGKDIMKGKCLRIRVIPKT